MVESATPYLNVMECPHPCSLCWLHDLPCSNGLALHLTQHYGQGLDHLGWHASINYHA